jgi:hypothetical protein
MKIAQVLSDLTVVLVFFAIATAQRLINIVLRYSQRNMTCSDSKGSQRERAKAAFPISMNKRIKPNYEEETTRHQRTT